MSLRSGGGQEGTSARRGLLGEVRRIAELEAFPPPLPKRQDRACTPPCCLQTPTICHPMPPTNVNFLATLGAIQQLWGHVG